MRRETRASARGPPRGPWLATLRPMAGSDSKHPPLTRARLLRVLALGDCATPDAIQQRGEKLIRALRARPDPDPATLREIEALERALERHAPRRSSGVGGRGIQLHLQLDRLSLIAVLLGVLVASIAFWFLAGEGQRNVSSSNRNPFLQGMPARLVLTGALPDATLRVLDADRETVLHERPAQNAMIELRPGRYALEVSSVACADRWTRSLYLEPGTTRTFAPALCAGDGGLRVVTNVEGARLFVDDQSVEPSADSTIRLPAGEYALRVEKDGYRTDESRVRIRSDQNLEVRVDLVRQRPGAVEGGLEGEMRRQAATPPPSLAAVPEPFDLNELRGTIAPPRPTVSPSNLLERAGLGGLPDGGSTAWHDRVSGEFLRRFDLDDSGRIDQIEENDEISCDYWLETEASFDRGGLGLSMARYYGFDGSEWHAGALGFDRSLRGAAYERMRACGLQT